MKLMKKLLVIFSVAFVVVGCSSNSNNGNKNTSSAKGVVESFWSHLQKGELDKIEDYVSGDESGSIDDLVSSMDLGFENTEDFAVASFKIIFGGTLSNIKEDIDGDTSTITADVQIIDAEDIKEKIMVPYMTWALSNLDATEEDFTNKMVDLFIEYSNNPKFSDQKIPLTFTLDEEGDSWTITDLQGLEDAAEAFATAFMEALS